MSRDLRTVERQPLNADLKDAKQVLEACAGALRSSNSPDAGAYPFLTAADDGPLQRKYVEQRAG